MRRSIAPALLSLISLAAACGSVEPNAAAPDAPSADAAVSTPMPPQRAVVLGAAGRATGGAWSADVQIGFAVSPTPTRSSNDELTSAATLIP